jgi:hypothetical protein
MGRGSDNSGEIWLRSDDSGTPPRRVNVSRYTLHAWCSGSRKSVSSLRAALTQIKARDSVVLQVEGEEGFQRLALDVEKWIQKTRIKRAES